MPYGRTAPFGHGSVRLRALDYLRFRAATIGSGLITRVQTYFCGGAATRRYIVSKSGLGRLLNEVDVELDGPI